MATNYGVNHRPFVMKVSIANDGDSFQWSNQAGTRNAVIDWGDGSPREISTSDLPAHVYESAGEYLIKITGEYTPPTYMNTDQVIAIEQWGDLPGWQDDDWINTFRDCDIVSLPENEVPDFRGITYFGNTFMRNRNLQSIPENLFAKAPDATLFGVRFNQGTFMDCRSITELPENLFAQCPEVTRLIAVFRDCNGISEIPENLFAHNLKLSTLGGVFRRIGTLPSGVPEDLFAHNPELTSVSSLFYFTNIGSIPENLFAHNPNLEAVESSFHNCGITEIPENLFANNPLLRSVRWTFGRNSGLTSIPANLFANNPNIEVFGRSGRGVFEQNPSLTSVPSGLFDNNTIATDFEEVFDACPNLTDVPANLFDTQTRADNYLNCFRNTNLTQTSIDNVLVSIAFSASQNNITNGVFTQSGGSALSAAGESAIDTLVGLGWTVSVTGGYTT